MEKLRGLCLKMSLCLSAFNRMRSGADCEEERKKSHKKPPKGSVAAKYGLITCSTLVICI